MRRFLFGPVSSEFADQNLEALLRTSRQKRLTPIMTGGTLRISNSTRKMNYAKPISTAMSSG
jgi:hypothetical protein